MSNITLGALPAGLGLGSERGGVLIAILTPLQQAIDPGARFSECASDLPLRRALRLSPTDPFSAICSGIVAHVEFVGGNYHEAMRLAREAIRQRTDLAGACRVLTAAAAMADEMDVAEAALQELRRVQPNISLAWVSDNMPDAPDERGHSSQTFPSARDHYLEAFRRVGLD